MVFRGQPRRLHAWLRSMAVIELVILQAVQARILTTRSVCGLDPKQVDEPVLSPAGDISSGLGESLTESAIPIPLGVVAEVPALRAVFTLGPCTVVSAALCVTCHRSVSYENVCCGGQVERARDPQ